MRGTTSADNTYGRVIAFSWNEELNGSKAERWRLYEIFRDSSRRIQAAHSITMAGTYHREPLIAATRMTAAANLAMLRTQAASRKLALTPTQATAAIRIAFQLEKVVYEHARRRTIQ
jgi:hypothetical protein